MIETSDGTTMTIANNWLDTGTTYNNWTYPTQTQPCISWYSVTPSKITLKLSEIERLRSAAKKDKALREILQKFTGHIEIEVDF